MANCSLEKRLLGADAVQVLWNEASERVRIPYLAASIQLPVQGVFEESGCLGMQPKMGGKFHLKLNTGTRPIANKYREGKMKSTLKRELKAREAVKMETIKVSSACLAINLASAAVRVVCEGSKPTRLLQCK